MILIATVLMQGVMTFAILAPLIVAPVVLSALGVPASWTGFYAPTVFGCAAVVSIYTGAMLRHVGPWRLSFASLAVSAVGMLVFAASTPLAIAFGGMVAGVGYGPITGAGAAIVVQSKPRNLSLAMSVRQSGVPLGASLAGFVLPSLTDALGWEGTCLLVGAVMLAGSTLAYGVLMLAAPADFDAPNSGAAAGMRPFHLATTNAALRRIAFVTITFAALQNCFTSFLSVYLVNHIHRTLAIAGVLLGTSQAIGMFARVIWGALADRIGAIFVLGILGFTMAAAAVTTGMLSPEVATPILFTIIVLFGATVTGWNGITMAQATKLVSPALGGAATGEIAACAYIGFIVGPPVFSAIAEASQFRYGYVAIGVLCALSTLTTVFGARKRG